MLTAAYVGMYAGPVSLTPTLRMERSPAPSAIAGGRQRRQLVRGENASGARARLRRGDKGDRAVRCLVVFRSVSRALATCRAPR